MIGRQKSYRHGVSINGELQVYIVSKYTGGEVDHEVVDGPRSPKDVQKMGAWDIKSQQIVEALYKPEIIEEVWADIAYYTEKFKAPEFYEAVRYDRMMDDLSRISIRKVIELIENGKVISKKYHRSWIMPGGTFSDKDILSKTLAENFHTPENIEIFHAEMAENEAAFETGLNKESVII